MSQALKTSSVAGQLPKNLLLKEIEGFHRTRSHMVVDFINHHGFSPTTKSLYGKGVYMTRSYESQCTLRMEAQYGPIVLVNKVALDNVLILDVDLFTKVYGWYGTTNFIAVQYDRMNLLKNMDHAKLAKLSDLNYKLMDIWDFWRGKNYHEYIDSLSQTDRAMIFKSEKRFSADIALELHEKDMLSQLGWAGVAYTGRQDGPCITMFNTDQVTPIKWAEVSSGALDPLKPINQRLFHYNIKVSDMMPKEHIVKWKKIDSKHYDFHLKYKEPILRQKIRLLIDDHSTNELVQKLEELISKKLDIFSLYHVIDQLEFLKAEEAGQYFSSEAGNVNLNGNEKVSKADIAESAKLRKSRKYENLLLAFYARLSLDILESICVQNIQPFFEQTQLPLDMTKNLNKMLPKFFAPNKYRDLFTYSASVYSPVGGLFKFINQHKTCREHLMPYVIFLSLKEIVYFNERQVEKTEEYLTFLLDKKEISNIIKFIDSSTNFYSYYESCICNIIRFEEMGHYYHEAQSRFGPSNYKVIENCGRLMFKMAASWRDMAHRIIAHKLLSNFPVTQHQILINFGMGDNLVIGRLVSLVPNLRLTVSRIKKPKPPPKKKLKKRAKTKAKAKAKRRKRFNL